MPITISKASWHALLYKWFYRVYSMPKSLCPYFWKLLISLIMVAPVIIMSLPAYFLIIFFKERRSWIRKMRHTDRVLQSFVGLLLYLCMLIFYHTVLYIYKFMIGKIGDKWDYWAMITTIGCIIWMIILFILGVIKHRKDEADNKLYEEWRKTHPGEYFYEWKWQRRHSKKKCKHPKNWLIVLAIKAWYEERCPLIEWEES